MKNKTKPKRINKQAVQAQYKSLIRKRKLNVSRMVDAIIAGEAETYEELKKVNEDLNADIEAIEKEWGIGA